MIKGKGKGEKYSSDNFVVSAVILVSKIFQSK